MVYLIDYSVKYLPIYRLEVMNKFLVFFSKLLSLLTYLFISPS